LKTNNVSELPIIINTTPNSMLCINVILETAFMIKNKINLALKGIEVVVDRSLIGK
jgi:hypothetical protein